MSGVVMSYLVCDSCGSYYELQPGESPEDFSDKCECGGHLSYVQDLDETDGSNEVCPNCGSAIEDDNEVCSSCGFELKESPLTENQLIFGFLWYLPQIGIFMMGFIALMYMLGIVIVQIFNPQPITDFYWYLLTLLFALIFPIILLVVIIALIRRFKSRYIGLYEKKNLNWVAMVVAFLIAIVIGMFYGRYLPNNVSLLGPLIGGFIAGCIVGKSYINGLVNGGIPAGIAGFIGAPLVMLLFNSEMHILNNSSPEMALILLSVGAIAYFIVFFLIGSIGGILGAGIRKRINS
jgi:hypothetical protein